MASKAGARIKITLRCSECKQRNYNTMKNKKNTPDRLELNKYCPSDGQRGTWGPCASRK